MDKDSDVPERIFIRRCTKGDFPPLQIYHEDQDSLFMEGYLNRDKLIEKVEERAKRMQSVPAAAIAYDNVLKILKGDGL